MAGGQPTPDTGGDAGVVPDREYPPGIPRWLKVSAIIVVVVVLAVVGISLIAGVQHGPGQFGPGQHGPGPSSWRPIVIVST